MVVPIGSFSASLAAALADELCDLVLLQSNTSIFRWQIENNLYEIKSMDLVDSYLEVPYSILMLVSEFKRLTIEFSWLCEKHGTDRIQQVNNSTNNLQNFCLIYCSALEKFLHSTQKKFVKLKNSCQQSLIRILINLINLKPAIDLFKEYLTHANQRIILEDLQHHSLVYIDSKDFRLDSEIITAIQSNLSGYFDILLIIDQPQSTPMHSKQMDNMLHNLATIIARLRREDLKLTMKINKIILECLRRISRIQICTRRLNIEELISYCQSEFRHILESIRNNFLAESYDSKFKSLKTLQRAREQLADQIAAEKLRNEIQVREFFQIQSKYLCELSNNFTKNLEESHENALSSDIAQLQSNIALQLAHTEELKKIAQNLVDEHLKKYRKLMAEQQQLAEMMLNCDINAIEEMSKRDQLSAEGLFQNTLANIKNSQSYTENKECNSAEFSDKLAPYGCKSLKISTAPSSKVDITEYQKEKPIQNLSAIIQYDSSCDEIASQGSSLSLDQKSFDCEKYLAEIEQKFNDHVSSHTENPDVTAPEDPDTYFFMAKEQLDSGINYQNYDIKYQITEILVQEVLSQLQLVDNFKLVYNINFSTVIESLSKFMLLLDTTISSAAATNSLSHFASISNCLLVFNNDSSAFNIEDFSPLILLLKHSKFKNLIDFVAESSVVMNSTNEHNDDITDSRAVSATMDMYFALNQASPLFSQYFESDCYDDFCSISRFFVKLERSKLLLTEQLRQDVVLGRHYSKKHKIHDSGNYSPLAVLRYWICTNFYSKILNFLHNLASDLFNRFKESVTRASSSYCLNVADSPDCSGSNMNKNRSASFTHDQAIVQIIKNFVSDIKDTFLLSPSMKGCFFGDLIGSIVDECTIFASLSSQSHKPGEECQLISQMSATNFNDNSTLDWHTHSFSGYIDSSYQNVLNYNDILIKSLSNVEEFSIGYKLASLFLLL
ncbi:MAG: hypothetical protein MHMPM18_000829 [Marteilia pararefringens]